MHPKENMLGKHTLILFLLFLVSLFVALSDLWRFRCKKWEGTVCGS